MNDFAAFCYWFKGFLDNCDKIPDEGGWEKILKELNKVFEDKSVIYGEPQIISIKDMLKKE